MSLSLEATFMGDTYIVVEILPTGNRHDEPLAVMFNVETGNLKSVPISEIHVVTPKELHERRVKAEIEHEKNLQRLFKDHASKI